MLALLKKDFLTNRFIFTISLLIGGIIIILLSMKSTEGSITFAAVATMLVPMIGSKVSSTEEMRKNYDLIMNSFPVKRSDVVISRYLSSIISYLVTTIIFFALAIFFNKLSGEDLNIYFFVGSLIFLYYVLFTGLTSVIYYIFPYEVVAKYSTVIMLLVIYVPIIIISLTAKFNPAFKQKVNNIFSSGDLMYIKIAMLIILAGIILYTLAIVISVIGYKHKDLN